MFEAQVHDVTQEPSTGDLPGDARIDALLAAAHARYCDHHEGAVVDYIPILSTANPDWFGLSVAEITGSEHRLGDSDVEFSMLSRFAGRSLCVAEEVYDSESKTNQRNRAIARLLESYGRVEGDPLETVDIDTRQCAIAVTANDLAVMGATLASGGVNPVAGLRVVSAESARDTLSVLAECGMYERSGEWLFEVGLPAKPGGFGRDRRDSAGQDRSRSSHPHFQRRLIWGT